MTKLVEKRTVDMEIIGDWVEPDTRVTDLGHDSFLLESEELYGLVRGFLERDQPYVFDYAI
jgi:homoserine acetyltransferase